MLAVAAAGNIRRACRVHHKQHLAFAPGQYVDRIDPGLFRVAVETQQHGLVTLLVVGAFDDQFAQIIVADDHGQRLHNSAQPCAEHLIVGRGFEAITADAEQHRCQQMNHDKTERHLAQQRQRTQPAQQAPAQGGVVRQ